MTAAPTTSDVAAMALEAVMRGEVDEARDLIGQLEPTERVGLGEAAYDLYRIVFPASNQVED